jgi:hypothetical protein
MVAEASHLGWEEKIVLIIGRASPEPSKKHIETVCTGGITEDGQLLRLYPIPLRYLEPSQKYKLWSWVKFEVQKNPQDKRKESYKVRENSIRVLTQVTDKSEQFSLLSKGIFGDREELEQLYKQDWTSVGVIEIELVGIDRRKQRKDWAVQKPSLRQGNLYTKVLPLSQIPIELIFKYRCKNNPNCKSHKSTLIGWEYIEAFRQFTVRYKTIDNAYERLTQKVIDNFADPHKSTFALVGTHSRHPIWMVAQLYWFEKAIAPRLFSD